MPPRQLLPDLSIKVEGSSVNAWPPKLSDTSRAASQGTSEMHRVMPGSTGRVKSRTCPSTVTVSFRTPNGFVDVRYCALGAENERGAGVDDSRDICNDLGVTDLQTVYHHLPKTLWQSMLRNIRWQMK